MRHREIMSPIDWVRRVNRSWLVRSNLNEHAEAWLDYLAELDDGRLLIPHRINKVTSRW